MRRRELPLSLGETVMPTVRRSADTGIRSFRNSTQPLHTNCSSSAAPLRAPLLVLCPYRGRLEEALRQADTDTDYL